MSRRRPSRTARVIPLPATNQPRWNIRKLALLGAGFLLILVALVVWLMQLASTPPEGVESFDVPSREHVEGTVAYAQTPPVGGDHSAQWQNCGFYNSQIPSERAVHSMEHGAVWITYRSELNPDEVTRIRQLASGQSYVVASSFRDLPSPVVASAWGRQLKVESTDDPRLERFIRAFRQSSTAPERGAPCWGGVGIPN